MGSLAEVEHGRRAFLKTSALVGGCLLLGFTLPVRAARLIGAAAPLPSESEFTVTAWVRITPDNEVKLIVSQAEIGQGISTTLPAILADELGADWESVELETAPYDPAYANPKYKWMFTGNSESIQAFYDHMRTIGAAARTMLTQAAARRWGVSASECRVEKSAILHASDKRLTFGDVAADASTLPVPDKPLLKPASERVVDGKALPRVDVPAKADGTAVFGIDFRVPNMLLAAVRAAPTIGGTVKRYDENAIKTKGGVRAVVPVPNGVAVVADTYWQARSALAVMPIEFDAGPNASVDSQGIRRAMRSALDKGPWVVPINLGDAASMIARSQRKLSLDYENPFLAHATMEPMNCTAHVTANHCEVWAPTQGQNLAFYALQEALKMAGEQIVVNRTPYIGGGFGRRLLPDFVVQAALVSKAVGRPVKLIWDREEDMRHDSYRPATMVQLTAALDASGRPTAIYAKVVSPRIITAVAPFMIETVDKSRLDPSAMEGMTETRYKLEHRRVDFHLFDTPIPTSVLRTTGYGPNIFAFESFVDELAHAAKQDPYRYRRALLADDARALAVLDRAARLGDWEKPLPTVRGAKLGRGIAYADAFGTLLAIVLEVEVRHDKQGDAVRLHRAAAAVDCGRVLDPGISASSIEGGIVFGLAGCKSEVTFKNGRIEQENFTTYQMPYLAETPDVQVEFIDGGGALGGVGEVSPVVVAPALANAIFAATGRRIRSMPLSRHGLRFA
jgi:isoquinoline 1-oxidoreductase beta subunit